MYNSDSDDYPSSDEFGTTVTATQEADRRRRRRRSSAVSVGAPSGTVHLRDEEEEVVPTRRVFQRLPAVKVMGKPCAALALLLLSLAFAIHRAQSGWQQQGVVDLYNHTTCLRSVVRTGNVPQDRVAISPALHQHFAARRAHLETMAAVTSVGSPTCTDRGSSAFARELAVVCAAWEAKAFTKARLPRALQEWALLPIHRVASCLCHDLQRQPLAQWCNTTQLFEVVAAGP